MRTVGVDIGGTFTDLMLYDSESEAVHVHKVPSTREQPDRAMVRGLLELCERAGVERRFGHRQPDHVLGRVHLQANCLQRELLSLIYNPDDKFASHARPA